MDGMHPRTGNLYQSAVDTNVHQASRTIQSFPRPLNNLKIVWLGFWRYQTMPDQSQIAISYRCYGLEPLI